MDYQQLLNAFGNDLALFVASVMLLLLYHSFLAYKVKQNPGYTVQSVNVIARTAWVHAIMHDGQRDVLPIQTLRNSTMAATFLASTSVLLIMGVMSLSGEAKQLDSSWHALNVLGAKHAALWQFKLLLILIDLFFSFFCFSMSIRLFNHVGYLINVPQKLSENIISPAHVASHLNRAGRFFSIGMRSYHFLMPLVFWLFGPHLMLIGTIGLVLVLYYVDRAPKLDGIDPDDDSA